MNKNLVSAFAASFLISLTVPLYSFAANPVPEAYKFVPSDVSFTFDLKNWNEISKNKSLSKLDLLSFFNPSKAKTNKFDFLSDPEIKKNLGSDFVIAVPDFSTKKGQRQPLMMLAEIKNNKQAYFKTKLLGSISGKSDSKAVESAYKDAKIISVIPKNPQNTSFEPSYYVFLKNHVLSTNNVSLVQNAVKTYYNQANSLSRNQNFLRSYSKLGSDYQMQVYMNMKKMFSLFSEANQDKDMAKTMKMFQSQNYLISDSLMANLYVSPKSIELSTYSILDKNNNMSQALLQSKSSSFYPLINYVPKNSIAFIGFSEFNFNSYFQNFIEPEELKSLNTLFNKSFGINMDEIYSNIKDDMAIAVFNTQDNPLIPGFALFMTPKDKQKMNQTIGAFRIDLSAFDKKRGNRSQRQSNLAEKKEILKFSDMTEYKGQKIVVANEIPSLLQLGVKPSYTFIDDRIIFASNEEVMRSVIDRILNNAPDFTLEKNDHFEKMKKIMGAKNNSIGYINLSSLVNIFANMTAGDKNASELIANLKKIHAIGFNSINDQNGTLGKMVILLDLEQIDFDKLLIPDKKELNLKDRENIYY